MLSIEEEIQSSFKNEHHKLMVNIQLTASRFAEKIQLVMKDHDLTSTQFNVLRILRGQKQKPASIGLIKERMVERNSDVSRIIDRLLKKGLISRTENEIDRRQKDVIISQSGLDVLQKIDDLNDLIPELLNNISDKEARQLNNLLDKARNTPKP